MIDLFGHVFYLFILLGLILLTRGNVWGWAARLVGEAGWVVIGVFLNLSSVYIWGSVFCVIDAYGFYKWRKKDVARK